jgi:hypothetical protein
MVDRLRRARRGLIGAGLGLVLVVVAAWIGLAVSDVRGQLNDVRSQLSTAERDNRVLAQQVRDLGGTPKVSPAPGPAGPAGSPGVSGQPGASGAPGRPGAGGTPGSPGASGKTGAAGTPGSPGPSGAMGAQGPAGPAGKDGQDGKDGATGPQGPAGSPGPTCPSGYHLTTETVVTSSGPQQAALCEPDGMSP